MSKPKVFVSRRVPKEGLDLLREKCTLQIWDEERVCPRTELLQRVKGIDGLFCTVGDNIDLELLNAAGPSLKVVATMSVGKDHIDINECSRRDIYVANTPDLASDSAADLSIALILMITRRIVEGIDAVKKEEWQGWSPAFLCGNNLMKKTIGILGFGRVGFGIARRLKPFGVGRIIYYDIREIEFASSVAELVSLDELYSKSDVLCVCCRATHATKGMINKQVFKMMKPSAVLVNTARGVIVNHDDLAEALTDGTISAAGLDVTEPEPLPANHRLKSLSNCVILPHMGTNTVEARQSMSINTAKNIIGVVARDKNID